MKHILMVDDVATNLILASEVLRDHYEISSAKSGKQALLMLNEITPDLIMLDVNMPQMDGFEVFEKIQKNPVWADIPVVFLTAETDITKEVQGLSMGAVEFLHKPFDPDVLKTRIDKILSMKDQQKELKSAAGKDELTSLSTRKSLEAYIASEPADKRGYFLILDLDNFKEINDAYGHVVGDSVLVRLSRVFEQTVREADRVCRLGGDEFGLYLNGDMEPEQVKNVVRLLIASTEFEIGDLLSEYSDYRISLSVGIAVKPSDGEDFMTLYANADKALYFVKQNGKRGYHFFDSMATPEEIEEENNTINLLQLKRLISEQEESQGAYKVEYDGFKKIYRFVARSIDRKNQEVQIVLFTLEKASGPIVDSDARYVDMLGDSIQNHLRRGDVATRCGECQYVVILMDASPANGRKVANRIADMFERALGNPEIRLHYELQTVTNGSAGQL
ncbi:MAG: diguanylate cyclase [Lachnospiraceae bacterium]|nr:diguanylate cyclase [Lachnospiraceae bacterium]